MKNDTGAYRSIMKGTAIFGGVQVINVLIGLVRGKLVALFLGVAGLGVVSLFTATCSTIQQFASLGLNLASVRDISAANECGNVLEASRIVKALRQAIKFSAYIGALFTALFAGWLSEVTFGSDRYKWSFIFLSVFVFFSLLANGENSILQGFRQLKSLAVCNVAGALCGLFVGVPLYYWKGVDGIVPALIASSLVLYGFSWYGTRKIGLKFIQQTWKENSVICRSIIVIGILMTVGACLGNLANYIILGFIRCMGSIEHVGLYNAANSLTMQYCGLVFTAMATDYYPRLSGIIHNKKATLSLVNQQTELVLLIITPIVSIVLLIAPAIIALLLTQEFLSIVELVRYMAFGLVFKAFCFPMGYLSISKGDKLYYFAIEGIWTNIKTPLIFICMYYFYGLNGLGYAAILNSLIDAVVVSVLTYWRYGIVLPFSFYRLALPLVLGLIGCFIFSFIKDAHVSYSLMLLASVGIVAYSFRELDKRISIRNFVTNKFSKKKNE